MTAAGIVAGLAALGQFFDFDFTNFFVPTSLPSVLDWLAGGPGAPPGTFQRWVTFMVSGIIAAVCFAILKGAWTWAAKGRFSFD